MSLNDTLLVKIVLGQHNWFLILVDQEMNRLLSGNEETDLAGLQKITFFVALLNLVSSFGDMI